MKEEKKEMITVERKKVINEGERMKERVEESVKSEWREWRKND